MPVPTDDVLTLPPKGALIAFCGIDGCGKTTQLRLLGDRLRARYPVLLTKQPTPAFRKDPVLRGYLDRTNGHGASWDTQLGPEIGLLAAADSYRHVRTEILPWLRTGGVALTDRYVFTNLAYAEPRGFAPVSWVREINRYVPWPDLTIYLDVPARTALERIRQRGERPRWDELDLARTEQICRAFREQPWGATAGYHVLDGTLPVHRLAARITALTDAMLRAKGLPGLDPGAPAAGPDGYQPAESHPGRGEERR